MRARLGRSVVVIVPVVFLAALFAWPVLRTLLEGLRPGGRWQLGRAWEVVAAPSTRRVLWFTVWQAVISTLATLLIGLPGAYALSRVRFRGRAVAVALVTIPFTLPTVVVASAFKALGVEGSVAAIVAAHVFFNTAVVIRTVGGLWSHLDPALEDAARSLGASRRRAMQEVTWPLLRPAVIAAASLTFLFCFTSFGVIVILGGVQYATIEVAIKEAVLDRLDLTAASVLAMLQLAVVATLVVAGSRLGDAHAGRHRLLAAVDAQRSPRTPGERTALVAILATLALVLGTPLAILVERSFRTASGWGFDAYRALGTVPQRSSLYVAPSEAIATSLRYAAVATIVAVVVGGCAAAAIAGRAGRRALDVLVMLPLGTSAVTVAVGFLLGLDRAPLDLRSSWWLVPLAQALLAVPFVVRIVVPVLRAIDPGLREAAATLGAGPLRARWELDVPIVRRALLVAAGFAFAISLGEFGATLLLARADSPTIPVAIFRLLSRPGSGSFAAAMALSSILMVMTGVALFAIERIRLPGERRF
ncbi:MAG: ABC transporter permease [Acidimicrobiales bacterium]